MGYYEIKPPDYLQPFIECFWYSQNSSISLSFDTFPETAFDTSPGPSSGSSLKKRKSLIVPDGCADILFKFPSGVANRKSRGALSDVFRVFTIGQMSEASIHENDAHVLYAGIRIHPGYAYYLLETSMACLTNKQFALEDVNPALFSGLTALLKKSCSIKHFFSRLGPFLYDLFDAADKKGKPDGEIAVILEKIRLSRGTLSLAELKAGSAYSLRTIQRKCKEYVGFSPKMLSRIIRFRTIYQRIKSGPFRDLTTAALDCGYYDQAHFNHDFKELSGFTPIEMCTFFPS